VTIWQTSATLAEAARRAGMPVAIASARAGEYRKKGIPLKSMPRGRKRLDVAGLKALAEILKPNNEV
jgi:hypothetical protein